MAEKLSTVEVRITMYARKENYKLPYLTLPYTVEQEKEVSQSPGEHHKKWTGVLPEILKRTLSVPRPCFVGKACTLYLRDEINPVVAL